MFMHGSEWLAPFNWRRTVACDHGAGSLAERNCGLRRVIRDAMLNPPGGEKQLPAQKCRLRAISRPIKDWDLHMLVASLAI
jgi:hypothetical protein